jgi:hypothetical protein
VLLPRIGHGTDLALGTQEDLGAASPLRRRRRQCGTRRPRPRIVGDVLIRLGARAQLEIRPTGHSPRRGLVKER